jgi:glycosyltransferase involved in cell wall biosynthesis
MLGCPIQRNREFIIKDYLTCIEHLDYPKKNIHMAFLINGKRKDKTEEIIFQYQRMFGEQYDAFDIWVIDDNGDDSQRINRDYNHFAEIRNVWLTMRRKKDKYILSIDSDILFPPNTIKELLKTSKYGMSAAPVLNLDMPDAKVWNFLFKKKEGQDYVSAWKVPKTPKEVDATGACVMFDVEILNKGVTYGYHPQGEDLYFCNKVQEKGYKIFINPNIETEHIMVR